MPNYKPTAAEIVAFNEDLTDYVDFLEEEGRGDFTVHDLRVLAQRQWPGKTCE
jgi:hypothetical protein